MEQSKIIDTLETYQAPPSSNTSSSSVVLGEALPENHELHHHIAVVLSEFFPQLLLSPCWIKKEETSPGCTCVECGGTVLRCLNRIRSRSESLRERLHRIEPSLADRIKAMHVDLHQWVKEGLKGAKQINNFEKELAKLCCASMNADTRYRQKKVHVLLGDLLG